MVGNPSRAAAATGGQTILADQKMDRLGGFQAAADEAAMFTQQVVVSRHSRPNTMLLSQTAKTNKSRLRSDHNLNGIVKSTYY